MNQRRATLLSILLSILMGSFAVITITVFWWLYGMFPLGNLDQTCDAVIRLDGVLFGFVLAVFAFSIDRIKAEERDWGYIVLISIFISLFGSILFAFLGLLSVDRWAGFSVISISLTLGEIASAVFWIQDLAFPRKNHKL